MSIVTINRPDRRKAMDWTTAWKEALDFGSVNRAAPEVTALLTARNPPLSERRLPFDPFCATTAIPCRISEGSAKRRPWRTKPGSVLETIGMGEAAAAAMWVKSGDGRIGRFEQMNKSAPKDAVML
ncbi:hypothetical protein [uncultured Algimonas sp.]|uniref:hypothetical protein n=1 Tax=uncultured Algimonas sp. TaxID=1547920 RepID=UPI00261F0ECE|nr:hypothetical protein [uncultured Algimonas sp.]